MKADSCDNLISIYSVVCAISNLPHALFLACGSGRRYGFKDICGSRAIFVWKYDPLISVWAKMAWILRCSRLPQYRYKWHGFYRCLLSLRTFSWMKSPRPCLSIKTIFPGSSRVHSRQGNVREKWNFSRSGNCQGILQSVREILTFAKLMKNVMEFHIKSGKMTILDNMTL